MRKFGEQNCFINICSCDQSNVARLFLGDDLVDTGKLVGVVGPMVVAGVVVGLADGLAVVEVALLRSADVLADVEELKQLPDTCRCCCCCSDPLHLCSLVAWSERRRFRARSSLLLL